jgi:hypothetical protein
MTFIGPKPVDSPKYFYPFNASGGRVYDENGTEVARVDLSTYEDDKEMAEEIAAALNARFAPATTTAAEKSTVTAEVFDLGPGGNPFDLDGKWFVVEGKAYYQDGGSHSIEASIWTPEELREEFAFLGTAEIDPAILAGVEGRE